MASNADVLIAVHPEHEQGADRSLNLLDAESPLLAPTVSKPKTLPEKYYPLVPILCGLLSIVADFGGGLTVTPEVRILEMAVCRDYYRIHDPTVIGAPPYRFVEEHLCKLNPIQVKLAYIRAWKGVLTTIPGLLLTIPLGRLADKYGRKPVLLLGMAGHLMSFLWVLLVCYFYETFATEWVLASFLFLFIGGGVRVLSAIINCVVVDVSPEGLRTTTFYLIGAAVHITDIVAPPVGSWLLTKNVWLPFQFGTPILLLAFPVILAMPETKRPSIVASGACQSDNELDGVDGDDKPTVGAWHMFIRPAQNTVSGLWSENRNITVCFAIVFLHSIATQSGSLILQFVSKLFDWPLARAGYLLSIKAFVAVAVLLVIVPVISRFATVRRGQRSLAVDLGVTRGSLALLFMGNAFIAYGANIFGVITGMILCSAGTSVPQAMQGLVATFADGSKTAQIFAALALIELVGTLVGGLISAWLFDVGVNVTPGLPYWGSAMLFLVTIFCTYLIRT